MAHTLTITPALTIALVLTISFGLTHAMGSPLHLRSPQLFGGTVSQFGDDDDDDDDEGGIVFCSFLHSAVKSTVWRHSKATGAGTMAV